MAEVQAWVQVRAQGLAVDAVYARLSWGLTSNPVWQRELGHLMGPVLVPVAEVLLLLEEAGIGTVRVSGQKEQQY